MCPDNHGSNIEETSNRSLLNRHICNLVNRHGFDLAARVSIPYDEAMPGENVSRPPSKDSHAHKQQASATEPEFPPARFRPQQDEPANSRYRAEHI
jgi:hypothetical protein